MATQCMRCAAVRLQEAGLHADMAWYSCKLSNSLMLGTQQDSLHYVRIHP